MAAPEVDWPTLHALIEHGDVVGVIDAVRGLDDRRRRALAAPLKAYAQRLRPGSPRRDAGPWKHGPERGRRMAALRAAGAGCLTGADDAARWLTRADLWPGPDQEPDRTLEALRGRPAPWLLQVARRMAERYRPADPRLAALVVDLVAVTGVEPPATEWFVGAWLRTMTARAAGPIGDGQAGDGGAGDGGTGDGGTGEERLAGVLRADPLLPAMVPAMFAADRLGLPHTAVAEPAAAVWALALARLAGDGVLDRAVLLDRCLGRLLRGGRRDELRAHQRLYQALHPTLDEVAARAPVLVRLVPDGPGTVAGLAQQELRRLDAAGRLDLDTLLEASRAILFRGEKKLVARQLAWLEAVARQRAEAAGAVLEVAAVAFGQDPVDLQERAVAAIVRCAGRLDARACARVLEAAAALPVDLRARLATALGAPAEVRGPGRWPSSVPLPPVPRPVPAPIDSPGALAEQLTALLHDVWHEEADPVTVELALAALVAFAAVDRAALRRALDPLLDRHHIRPGLPRRGVHLPNDQLEAVVGAAVGRVVPVEARRARLAAEEHLWRHVIMSSRGPVRLLLLRMYEMAAGLAAAPVPALLATPTTTTGRIDPGVLLGRIERAAAEGWQPWAYDLCQALLRLPRDIDPALAGRARAVGSAAALRLAGWITAGGLPDPAVTRVSTTMRPGVGHAGTPARDRDAVVVGAEVAAADLARLCPARLPGLCPAHVDPDPWPDVLTPPLLCDPARVQHDPAPGDRGHAWWSGCWPTVLPSHRDVVAAHLVPHLRVPGESTPGVNRALSALAEADGPVGPGFTLALAFGLAAAQTPARAAATEAVLTLIGRAQFPAEALGREVAALALAGAVTLSRVTAALRDAARSGGYVEVWSVVAGALPRLLPPACDKLPYRLVDLITLGIETAERAAARGEVPGLAGFAARPATSRAVVEARRLHRWLAG